MLMLNQANQANQSVITNLLMLPSMVLMPIKKEGHPPIHLMRHVSSRKYVPSTQPSYLILLLTAYARCPFIAALAPAFAISCLALTLLVVTLGSPLAPPCKL
jgi:hypothetical protein